jgi:hypothetical protein
MNTLLATATTWTLASISTAAITAPIVAVGVAHFRTISEHMAEATGRPRPVETERRAFERLLAVPDRSSKVGVGEAAAMLMSRPAEDSSHPSTSERCASRKRSESHRFDCTR